MFTSRPPRARDHGGGRPYTRTGQNGRRITFPGPWDGTQLAGQISATYVTVWIKVHIGYRQFHQILLTNLGKFGQTAEARM